MRILHPIVLLASVLITASTGSPLVGVLAYLLMVLVGITILFTIKK